RNTVCVAGKSRAAAGKLEVEDDQSATASVATCHLPTTHFWPRVNTAISC
ncbi:hypothetical protein A2U01_0077691, partial [Trifolium medium]|nr:hypothetical protein [Trifolium medium]